MERWQWLLWESDPLKDDQAQKLDNHCTKTFLPKSASSIAVNIRSNFNQNVKKLFGEYEEGKG